MKSKFLIGLFIGIILLSGIHYYTTKAVTFCFPEEGCLGTSEVPASGTVPIGTGGGVYTPKNLSAGSNITITNESGTVTIAGSAAGVGGSGTSTNVAFFSGAGTSTLSSNDLFFWNNTLFRLGVGTAQPSSTLHIVGTSTFSGFTQIIGVVSSTEFISPSGTIPTFTFSTGNGADLRVSSATVDGALWITNEVNASDYQIRPGGTFTFYADAGLTNPFLQFDSNASDTLRILPLSGGELGLKFNTSGITIGGVASSTIVGNGSTSTIVGNLKVQSSTGSGDGTITGALAYLTATGGETFNFTGAGLTLTTSTLSTTNDITFSTGGTTPGYLIIRGDAGAAGQAAPGSIHIGSNTNHSFNGAWIDVNELTLSDTTDRRLMNFQVKNTGGGLGIGALINVDTKTSASNIFDLSIKCTNCDKGGSQTAIMNRIQLLVPTTATTSLSAFDYFGFATANFSGGSSTVVSNRLTFYALPTSYIFGNRVANIIGFGGIQVPAALTGTGSATFYSSSINSSDNYSTARFAARFGEAVGITADKRLTFDEVAITGNPTFASPIKASSTTWIKYNSTSAGLTTTVGNVTTSLQTSSTFTIFTNLVDANSNKYVTSTFHGTSTPSLGGGALLAGACSTVTTDVPLALSSSTDSVLTMPQIDPGEGDFDWYSVITGLSAASSTITTKVCAIVAGTPTATPYNIFILRKSGI